MNRNWSAGDPGKVSPWSIIYTILISWIIVMMTARCLNVL